MENLSNSFPFLPLFYRCFDVSESCTNESNKFFRVLSCVRLVTGGISSIFVIGDSDDRFAETSLNPGEWRR